MLAGMRQQGGVRLRFGEYELDLEFFELRHRGVAYSLEPQVFDVLAYLLAHRDRVVTKGELLDQVWGDRFVSESALSTRIKEARRAVGDDGHRQGVIRTVHGRGFRVVADVEVVRDGAPSDERPSSLPGRPLPRPASSFVGRGDELGALDQLVGALRVVTICGPGGVGKTRMALELAARVAGRYPQAPRLLELAELEPSADVAAVVAATVGVQDRQGASVLERLVDAFAHQRLLLVLDNCEHVVDAAASLVGALIEGGEGVDVIATSRRPLHVDGEQVWPLEPLLTEASGHDDPPAVRLFLDRAAAQARPEQVTGLDRGLVRQACERVGGIPLGVELAASRVRHVGLEALVAALDDPGALRAVGGRADRHGSLEAVIAWSYDRLPPQQQQLFARLSVFAGRFDGSAAQHVAADDPPPAAALVDELSELVDQSMLAVDPEMTSARYSLLSPLREFGRRRLAASAEAPSIHRRHARWAVEVAAAADRSLRGAGAAGAFARFDELVPELRLAQRCLLDEGDFTAVAALCRGVFWFGHEQGRLDMLSWAQEALKGAAPDRAATLAVARASGAVAAWQRGDLPAARAHAEAAVSSAENPWDAGLARLALAEVRQLDGDHARAVRLGASISATAEQTDDPLLGTLAHVVQALSLAATDHGDAARRHAGIAADIAETCGSALARAWAGYAEGETRLETSPYVALDHLEAAWSLARSLDARVLAGVAGLSFVSLSARRGESDASLADFAELIDHWARAGTAMHQWATIRNLVQVLAQGRADEDSARLYGAISAAGRGAVAQGAEAVRLDRAMREVRRRLGPDAYDALLTEGAALPDNAVVAYAQTACVSPPTDAGRPGCDVR
jgi:predicted ATPase/DNA-binding winged helix-turn-helix (wHTH) protein